MVNILQTGDLHLGKVLYEHSLLEDQKHMLDLLIKELQAFSYDALLIAGDVYDRSVPSPEAVRLFDEFLVQVNALFPLLPICIISGNHDSQTRLSYASSFLRSKNIYISTDAEECSNAIIIESKDGQKIALYQIPFLQIGSLRSEDGSMLRSQTDLITEAIARIKRSHKKLQSKSEHKDTSAIVNCHLFTLQGTSSDSERLFLGNAELIDPNVFKPFLYTAIGHLHKKQKVLENAYYAGSPLAYSFSEIQTDKVFLRVVLNTENKAVEVTPIDIKPLRKLVQVEDTFENFEKMVEHKDDFIEFTCTNSMTIENIAPRLRKLFPYLLSIKQKAITSIYQNAEESISKRRALFEKKDALPVKEIFTNFLQDLGLMSEDDTDSSNSDWKECIELFESIAKELEGEKNEAN